MSQYAIKALQLSRNFGDLKAIQGLNLEVEKNRIYGFLGPNGSGKTTAIRMLTGLLKPTHGEIQVLGFKLPQEAEKLRFHIGYMTQKFSLYDDLTVKENLQFVSRIYGLSRREQKKRIDELHSPGQSLATKVIAGPTSTGAQKGKDVVFSEVERYYAMARDERYKMAIDAISRQPLELYDLLDDPREQRNLVHEPGLSAVREKMLHADFDRLLGLDQEKLETYKESLGAKPDTDTFATDLIRQFR